MYVQWHDPRTRGFVSEAITEKQIINIHRPQTPFRNSGTAMMSIWISFDSSERSVQLLARPKAKMGQSHQSVLEISAALCIGDAERGVLPRNETQLHALYSQGNVSLTVGGLLAFSATRTFAFMHTRVQLINRLLQTV